LDQPARIVEAEPSRRERDRGLLLDARCRWDACEMAGVEPRTEVYHGDVGFVLARNERRRQMSYIERLTTANKMAGAAARGRPWHSTLPPKRTVDADPKLTDIAVEMKISPSAITDYRSAHQYGAPHVKEGVDSGKVSVTTAARAIRGKSIEEQEEFAHRQATPRGRGDERRSQKARVGFAGRPGSHTRQRKAPRQGR
jgi:hypothetical protein